jgi:acyl-CoA thioester hydrolase
MSDTNFQYFHRVTYSDCTAGNHVYYGRFLDMLESARGEFFRQLGISFDQWQEKGSIFPVVECRLRYLAPARYDQVLRIEVWITAAQRVRLNFGYRITKEPRAVIIEGETFHVCTGLDEKPKRLPEDLLMLLKPHVRVATLMP